VLLLYITIIISNGEWQGWHTNKDLAKNFKSKCDYKQSDLLYKKANLKYIGHSIEIA